MYGLALCLPSVGQPQGLPVPHEIPKTRISYHVHSGFALYTLFLHVFVQTEADSIQFDQFDANRGHFYSAFGGQLGTFARLCDHPQTFHLT